MSLEPTQKYRFIRFTPPPRSSKQPKSLFVGTEHHLQADDECVITVRLVNSAFNLSQQTETDYSNLSSEKLGFKDPEKNVVFFLGYL